MHPSIGYPQHSELRRSFFIRMYVLVLFVASVALIETGNGFLFEMKPGSTKCFTERLLEGVRYQVYYKVPHSWVPFVSVTVKDEHGKLELINSIALHKSTQIVTAATTSHHAVCFSASQKAIHASGKPLFHLSIREEEEVMEMEKKVLEHASMYPKGVGATPESQFLEDSVNMILSGVKRLSNAYSWQYKTEKDMFDQTKLVMKTCWISFVVVVLLLILTSIFNYIRIRWILRKKKLLD